jgi:uncharacterized protein
MKRDSFVAAYGPWALITGAASGLGAEFASQCAAHGLNLVLLDRQEGALSEVAARLRSSRGIEVRTLVVDLARPDLLAVVGPATSDLEIGLLINNAAHVSISPFFDAPLADLEAALDVNVRAPIRLAHHFGRRMIERRRGGIIFLSSASALQGTALVATYAATKATNLILAEGLWYEAARHGVDVLGFMPGATRTAGFEASSPRLSGTGTPVMDPEPVVCEALSALGRTPSAVAGRLNRLAMGLMSRAVSRAMAIRIISRTMERMYPGRLTDPKGHRTRYE